LIVTGSKKDCSSQLAVTSNQLKDFRSGHRHNASKWIEFNGDLKNGLMGFQVFVLAECFSRGRNFQDGSHDRVVVGLLI